MNSTHNVTPSTKRAIVSEIAAANERFNSWLQQQSSQTVGQTAGQTVESESTAAASASPAEWTRVLFETLEPRNFLESFKHFLQLQILGSDETVGFGWPKLRPLGVGTNRGAGFRADATMREFLFACSCCAGSSGSFKVGRVG